MGEERWLYLVYACWLCFFFQPLSKLSPFATLTFRKDCATVLWNVLARTETGLCGWELSKPELPISSLYLQLLQPLKLDFNHNFATWLPDNCKLKKIMEKINGFIKRLFEAVWHYHRKKRIRQIINSTYEYKSI